MIEPSDRVEQKTKPKKCPNCGGGPIADILWGLPAGSRLLAERHREGKIVYGGCLLTGDDPKWACNNCGLRIYQTKRDTTP